MGSGSLTSQTFPSPDAEPHTLRMRDPKSLVPIPSQHGPSSTQYRNPPSRLQLPQRICAKDRDRGESTASAWNLTHLGLVVLETVSFIHHETGPADGAQRCLIDGDQLIGRQEDMELHLGLSLPTKPLRVQLPLTTPPPHPSPRPSSRTMFAFPSGSRTATTEHSSQSPPPPHAQY